MAQTSGFSRYQFIQQLGAGGMGEVYLAEDSQLGRKVALKLLSAELAEDDNYRNRFMREARAASALNHPNICTIYDAGKSEHRHLYIAMEYVQGETLASRLQQRPLDMVSVVDIGIQVADALAAAHAKGMVHRDIKPANISLGDHGLVKLLDFGLAKRVAPQSSADCGDPSQTSTAPGLVIGTPRYMSPEQVLGRELDPRSDLFSLGAVLYELLTRQPAFAGTTFAEVAEKIVNRQPERFIRFDTEVPAELERIIRKCLEKEPDCRYASAGELMSDLKHLRYELESDGRVRADNRPATDRKSAAGKGATQSAKPAMPRRRGVLKALGGACLIAALIAGAYLLNHDSAGENGNRSIAVLPFDTLGQTETSAFTEGIHGDVLTRLSTLSGLSVISRTSVMRFDEVEEPLPSIAQALGVTWVLRGEVQEAGDEVQVNARLHNARKDRQVWAQTYRRRLTAENLFQIQGELTRKIAEQLQAYLTPKEKRALERTPTDNLEAYRLCVLGRSRLDQRTEEGIRQAVGYFEKATKGDPSYAMAWVGLADALVLLEDYGYAERGSVMDRARQAARQALELAPELAEAHATLGLMHSQVQEGAEAIRKLERAVEIKPSYAEAHNWLAWVTLLLGHHTQALEAARRAVELNPLSPEAVSNLSLAYLVNGDYRPALQEARRTQEIQSDYRTGHFYEALALYHLGRFAEAKLILRGLSVPWAGSGPRATLALAHVAAGETARARELLAEFQESGESFNAGLVHAAFAEKDEALAGFANVDRWDNWPLLAFHSLFPDALAPLRTDPRYETLFHKVQRKWGLRPESEKASP